MNTTLNSALVDQCARSFYAVCGIGCTTSDRDGNVLFEHGYGYPSCKLCELAGHCTRDRMQIHQYGMNEAERFGGKYIYTCRMGLTFFVSPIFQDERAEAKITVGPFLMVDKKDFIACELTSMKDLSLKNFTDILEELDKIPSVSTRNVTDMSELLFMVIGYINNVSAVNRLLEKEETAQLQSDISSYIHALKNSAERAPYPIETEQALLRAVKQMDSSEAKRHLNELLGHIMFSYSDLSTAKIRVYELLVLLNRAVISSGSDVNTLLAVNERYFMELSAINDYDTLCFWLMRVMNTMTDSIFTYGNLRHSNVIHRSIQYMRNHYSEKLTLEQVAQKVYLSPSYFSRIFKGEIGESFTSYLNKIRVEQSMTLLKQTSLKLADIASEVGFSDQSYFNRIFRKQVGVSPAQYREST